MCKAFWELFQPEIEAEKAGSVLCGKKTRDRNRKIYKIDFSD